MFHNTTMYVTDKKVIIYGETLLKLVKTFVDLVVI